MVGRTLGHYRIEEQIGAGGMGVVYRARDERLDRDVALKVLPEGLVSDSGATDRLRKEALALSKLNHPNIAHVYDFDSHDGISFLIMEFVSGETLARKLASGRIAEEVAINIGIQTASALEDAAEAGVVHRDIKPSNIMFTAKGTVKVLDFGLAKLFHAADHDATRSHAELPDAAGTLAYMAPERLKDESADFRSDVYSLGTVLYESVTGKRPFVARDSVTLISDILNKKPVLPREFNSAISAGLESAVMRCLAKEPARRYQSAAELRVALESISESRREIPRVAAGNSSRNRRILAVFALALVLAIAVAGIVLRHAPTASLPAATAPPATMNELVVLPLANSGDDGATAFGNGLTETISSRLMPLSQDHPLEVVPASEVRAKGVKDLEGARKEFGATLGLRLNVERAAGQIRVTYELVDAREHKMLRGDTITEPESNPFAIEDDVAGSVVAGLQLQLSPAERQSFARRGTTQPGAYDYYLQGRGYLLEFQEPKNIDAAIAEFGHALEQDPSYALAYAGLGEAYWRKYHDTAEVTWVASAKSECERAVALRTYEAAGHSCLGLVYNGTGAYDDAVKQYREAADLDPTSDEAFRGLALAYKGLNRMDAAEKTFAKAIALRPGYWSNYNQLGSLYLGEKKHLEAEKEFSEVIRLAPDSWAGYGNLGLTYLGEGDPAKAIPLLERSIAIEPRSDNTSNLGAVYFDMRHFQDSARIFEKAVAISPDNYIVIGNLADAYYWSPGDREKSFPLYRKAMSLAQQNALRINPRDSQALAYVAGYHAALGESAAATDSIHRALTAAPDDSEVLLDAACVFAQIGSREKALEYLERAVAAGVAPNDLLANPTLDNLHGQPRFEKLVAKVPPA